MSAATARGLGKGFAPDECPSHLVGCFRKTMPGKATFTSESDNVLSADQGEGFGHHVFTGDEMSRISELLDRKLESAEVSSRKGPGGRRLSYITGHKVIELANSIFGFNGWSSAVRREVIDRVDKNGHRYDVGAHAIVRVTLRDGCYREDIGFGTGMDRNKSNATENALKEAVTDATKRCMRMFGSKLGNCLYDKSYLEDLRTARTSGAASSSRQRPVRTPGTLTSSSPDRAKQTTVEAKTIAKREPNKATAAGAKPVANHGVSKAASETPSGQRDQAISAPPPLEPTPADRARAQRVAMAKRKQAETRRKLEALQAAAKQEGGVAQHPQQKTYVGAGPTNKRQRTTLNDPGPGIGQRVALAELNSGDAHAPRPNYSAGMKRMHS